MKIFILLTLVALSQSLFSQNIDCKVITDLSHMEQRANSRLSYGSKQTGATNNFDVLHYRCEWEVDPAVRYISGKITVYFKMTLSGNSISFDLMNAGLNADSVLLRGLKLSILHSHDVLKIDFGSSMPEATSDSISIYYHGMPQSTGFGSFIQTSHAGVPVIWTLSEPYGSRDWWPCKNGLDDKADSIDIFITAPATYSAAANGLLQDEITAGTKKTTHWKHHYPIATYLVCFAVTNYTVLYNSVQLGSAILPMVTYCYPENLTLFLANTPLVLDALKLYHNTFGDYPFIKEKYGHVQFGWGGGQEHQTSTFIVTPNEGLMAHELAHQWFGDKVTCKSWADIWLNEGFATFVASFYSEYKYPSTAINRRKNEIAGITSLPDGSVWVDDTTNVNRIFNGRLSYNKGSHLLYMLRWKLGDSAFFKGLRAYLGDPKVSYGFASTGDLKRNLELSSGENLSEFFTDWFYGQGYPSYHVNWSQIGGTYVKINVSQITSHPSVSFFPMPLALQFKNATQQKTIVVNNTANGQMFYRDIGFRADTVLIDPDYWLITRNNVSNKQRDTISGVNIVQVFPNPVKNDLFVYLRNFNVSSVSIQILTSLGKIILEKRVQVYGSEFFDLPIQNIPNGTYFLVIGTGAKSTIVKKIVKLN